MCLLLNQRETFRVAETFREREREREREEREREREREIIVSHILVQSMKFGKEINQIFMSENNQM